MGQKKWTRSRLAKEVGYSPSYITRFINGEKPLTQDSARRFAVAFGVPLEEVLSAGGLPRSDDVAFYGYQGLTPERRREADRMIELLQKEQEQEQEREQRRRREQREAGVADLESERERRGKGGKGE